MPHLLSLSDLGKKSLLKLLDRADKHKDKRGQVGTKALAGKCVALVFEKASTRTRISLEVAVVELGGHPLVITSQGSQMGRGEPIRDTARVLSRMVHGITFRTSGPERLVEMAESSRVPVLNALTDTSHPMQLLADLMTVRRTRGKLTGLRYAWVGDGNNMAASWIEAAGLLGLELTLGCPNGYLPESGLVDAANDRGGRVRVVTDARAAVEGADVVSTDVFTSMGQEAETKKRLQAFEGYRLTSQLLRGASENVVVLHCLPAHRGEEIDDDVIEGPRSFVWDQAEARLHTAKAALEWALG
ncbi:MAG: ornithine carbamoyltransferase [Polyangiaceae bacterium]